jgi:hypothetical protein
MLILSVRSISGPTHSVERLDRAVVMIMIRSEGPRILRSEWSDMELRNDSTVPSL